MKFCNNCGHEVRADAKVCTNCGHSIEQRAHQDEKKRTPAAPKNKKKRLIVFSMLALAAVALIITYSILAANLSSSNRLDSISNAVESKNSEKLIDSIDTDISLEEADAYIEYIDQTMGLVEYSVRIDMIKSELDKGVSPISILDDDYKLLTAQRDGKQYVIFDDYNITIPRTNVNMTNEYGIDRFTYSFSDKEQEWQSDNAKFLELVPGIYHIEGAATVGEDTYDSAVAVDFRDNEEANIIPGFYYIELTDPDVSIFAPSIPAADYTVLINGEASEVIETENNTKLVGPFSLEAEVAIETTVEHEDQVYESAPKTIVLEQGELYQQKNGERLYLVHLAELEYGDSETVATDSKTEEELEGEFSFASLEPNAVADLVNDSNFEVVSTDSGYETSADIDGDGTEENIQILKNSAVDESEMQLGHYILAIKDEGGLARYAEYTYNFFGNGGTPKILETNDIDNDGISEIMLSNTSHSTATEAVGIQSPSRFIYKYDEDIDQFAMVPTLGRFLRNTEADTFDINVNDVITDLDYIFSYAETIEELKEDEESEGLLNDFTNFGILNDEHTAFKDDFIENTHGNGRFQYPLYSLQLGNDEIGILYENPVMSARWLTLNSTALYQYNPQYNWLEMVGMDDQLEDPSAVEKKRGLFTEDTFNESFNTDDATYTDYQGEWTMVTDGRIMNYGYTTLNIDEDEITEEYSGDPIKGHNITVDIDDLSLDDTTNQLNARGNITENDATTVNNMYVNTFTLVDIEGTWHLLDKYGNYYLKL